MATTTNFGWETPDDTDLVKDGALAMRTLGNAIDASMVDLKGGTTGQVLSKASNTDMDFTWVAQDDSNAIQNAIVDAKGDLIAASAADTPARLAVGNNGETLVADSSASTGLRWQADFSAGRNKILNSDFSIWQRGTSFNIAAYTPDVFAADRWRGYAGSGTATMSRQTFTPGTAPVAGYEGQYFFRYQQTASAAGVGTPVLGQKIEDVRTLAGQTVTLSFWAKAAASTSIYVQCDQNFGSGGSSTVSTTTGNFSLTTSWTRFSATVSLPSLSGKTIGTSNFLEFTFVMPTSGTFTVDLWGVQIESGNVATAFQTATGTLAGELAACQRYYWQLASGISVQFLNGSYYNSTQFDGVIQYPVTMRTAPTCISVSGTNYYVVRGQGDTCNSVAIAAATATTGLLYNASEISGTAFQAGRMETNNAAAAVALSAEL